jgi:hypothetical protein
MFTRTDKDKSERENYLEYELEREREGRRQEDDRRQRESEERRAENHERWEYEARRADTWPEALEKQSMLMWREAGILQEYEDGYFEGEARACDRALELWKEIAPTKQAEIEALEKQIEAIQFGICTEVATKLAAEGMDKSSVVQALGDEDVSLNNWLYW